VQEIAESAATGGPATAVLSVSAAVSESSVWAIVAIAGALGFAILLGAQDLQFSASTSLPLRAWACSQLPVWSCRRTRSSGRRQRGRQSRRCRASSRVSRSGSW